MVFKWLLGDETEKLMKRYAPVVDRVAAYEPDMKACSDEELRAKTSAFRERLTNGESLDDMLPEAFAVVREAAWRVLGQRHFDVQVLGGIVLHKGNIAEMKTGEGKTLAATLPVYLNALSGKGVHVITVNDYLARRDAVWMGQVYAFLGLSVGAIGAGGAHLYDESSTQSRDDEQRDSIGAFKVVDDFLRPVEKREAYAADITYGTNNEFGFDYLRDNIAYRAEDVAGRGFHYAVIDEIDSVLVDEARTPLIISAPAQEPEDFYHTFAKIAVSMERDTDYTVDEKQKAVELTENGITKAERALGVDNIYTEKGIRYVHHLENAVKAKALFIRDKEYVVRDGAIVIVDEFTGRLQPGRRWSQGLHQAIEAKEGMQVQRESRTIASITFQNFFRLYDKLSGMTGTAQANEEEFRGSYKLDVVPIPTNRPLVRNDYNDLIFQTEQGKYTALINTIKELHEKGQPVLIGTVSIEKNELLSSLLTKEGVPHEVLNAKNHEHEGEIIAQAGRRGAVTIATNMAGRGVDIILGGNPPEEGEQDLVRQRGGLSVIGTERHEARRIDDQLRGRAGRQGDPGASQFYVSLEDTLMRVFASDTIKNMMGRFGIPEDQPIENRVITRSLESAQKKIEGLNYDTRKHLLQYDNVLSQQRHAVYDERRKLLFGSTEAAETFANELIQEIPEAQTAIEHKRAEMGDEAFWRIFGETALRVIDIHWMEHLETMDYLRSSVNLRAYGQRDPLIEYKKEGLRLFKEMQSSIKRHVFELIPNMVSQQGAAAEEKPYDEIEEGRGGYSVGDDNQQKPQKPAVAQKTPGRNDPCFCGSGKKYKRCHGA